MRFLSEQPVFDIHGASPARRVATVVAGLLLGIGVSIAGFHGNYSGSSILSEAAANGAARLRALPGRKHAAEQRGWHQIGLASWYGPQFQGKETADGELYDMHDLTCAHRSLPLGTWVKVTDLHTHRWIVVRVNDRGPVPETRIADLSSHAARMLGMRARGVTRVRLDVIDPQQAVEVARLEKLRAIRLATAEQSVPVN